MKTEKNNSKQSIIPIHPEEDYIGMRKAGALAAEILDDLYEIIKPAVSYTQLTLPPICRV